MPPLEVLVRPGTSRIVLPVVVENPVDICSIHDRVGAEGVMRPYDDIGVLALLEGPHAPLEVQLLRRIDRDQRERLVFGQPSPLDALGRLRIQPARVLRAVGVDRHEHSLAEHDGRVVGGRVHRFGLVTPPVGKRGSPGPMGRHLLRDAVPLQHVVEGANPEAHLLGKAHEHQDLVGTVRMRVHQALAFEHFDQRLELQVPRLRQNTPCLLVGPCPREGVANHELDSGSRRRIPQRTVRPRA